MTTDTFKQFLSLCVDLKQKEAITYGVNEIEEELVGILNFIKKNELIAGKVKFFFKRILQGYENYPLEIIIFSMRELQWDEIKKTALLVKENSTDWRIISSMDRILAVYERDWDSSDLYEYYALKKQND